MRHGFFGIKCYIKIEKTRKDSNQQTKNKKKQTTDDIHNRDKLQQIIQQKKKQINCSHYTKLFYFSTHVFFLFSLPKIFTSQNLHITSKQQKHNNTIIQNSFSFFFPTPPSSPSPSPPPHHASSTLAASPPHPSHQHSPRLHTHPHTYQTTSQPTAVQKYRNQILTQR
jgi:hypothetical protein